MAHTHVHNRPFYRSICIITCIEHCNNNYYINTVIYLCEYVSFGTYFIEHVYKLYYACALHTCIFCSTRQLKLIFVKRRKEFM